MRPRTGVQGRPRRNDFVDDVFARRQRSDHLGRDNLFVGDDGVALRRGDRRVRVPATPEHQDNGFFGLQEDHHPGQQVRRMRELHSVSVPAPDGGPDHDADRGRRRTSIPSPCFMVVHRSRPTRQSPGHPDLGRVFALIRRLFPLKMKHVFEIPDRLADWKVDPGFKLLREQPRSGRSW